MKHQEKMESHPVLFDKRRQACYRRIPIVQYTHVSSTLSCYNSYNILISQLHRFSEIIMSRSNYILETAKLVRRMQIRGYLLGVLWRKLKRHLCLHPETYGDTNGMLLFQQVQVAFDKLKELQDFESATESQCGLSDSYTSLIYWEPYEVANDDDDE